MPVRILCLRWFWIWERQHIRSKYLYNCEMGGTGVGSLEIFEALLCHILNVQVRFESLTQYDFNVLYLTRKSRTIPDRYRVAISAGVYILPTSPPHKLG